ncbi:unnamed protein product, partial [Lymnaea stagnalis]
GSSGVFNYNSFIDYMKLCATHYMNHNPYRPPRPIRISVDGEQDEVVESTPDFNINLNFTNLTAENVNIEKATYVLTGKNGRIVGNEKE